MAMVSQGEDYAVFDDLPFQQAHAYAIEKGAKAADTNAASTHFVVSGKTYFVVFTRAHSGGTIFGVEDSQSVRERVLDRSKMEAHVSQKMKSIFDEFATSDRYRKAEKLTAQDIQSGIVKMPSWINDQADVTALFDTALAAALASGMSETLAINFLKHMDVSNAVVTSAAQFEIAGFSKLEQIAHAGAFTEKLAKAQIKAQSKGRV